MVGCAVCLKKTVIYWFCSMLGKYLPGKLFLVLGRIYLYKKNNINEKLILISIVLETVYGLVAALIIVQISIPGLIALEILELDLIYFYVLLFITLLLAHPTMLNYFIKTINMIINKPINPITIGYKNVLLIMLLNIINYLFLGFAFYLLVFSLQPVDFDHYFSLTGIYVLAGVVGIVAIFAPSGIGIRESALIILLPSVLPSSFVAILSIVSRLWETCVEIFLIGVCYLYAKTKGINIYKD